MAVVKTASSAPDHARAQPPGSARDARSRRTLLDNAHPTAWRNPAPAERYDLAVIGAGPAGLAAARAAAALGARVALVERRLIGGDRLNVGCVPSKAVIRTARLYAEMRSAAAYGAQTPAEIPVGFAAVMERMRQVQARLSEAASARRLTEAGIDVFFGAARFQGPDAVAVDGAALRFGKALIATGVRPMTPTIPGLAEAGYLTNETVFDLNECPERVLVIGGGPLGCELAQAFCRFGAKVIIAQDDPMFLPREERDAAQVLSDALARDGVEIHLNTSVVAVRREGAHKIVDLLSSGDTFSVTVDDILAGIGRSPNVEGLDLEAAGVGYDTRTGIHVDDFLRSSNRRIFAAGDVCLEHKFTHAAVASAHIAVHNALSPFRGRRRLSALIIPWCTYTDPEIAHVGLYVREARRSNVPVRTFTILMHDVDRAVTDGEEDGFVKVHVKEGTDRILGATVVASHAGEMINVISLAITSGIGLRVLARVVQAYPTQAEAIRMAAAAFVRTRIRGWPGALGRFWFSGRRPAPRPVSSAAAGRGSRPG
jgi:pyruvate/2-oxoglutarate dehydrogenase complex dihydrolipoamide dehydrogenase (E3) component